MRHVALVSKAETLLEEVFDKAFCCESGMKHIIKKQGRYSYCIAIARIRIRIKMVSRPYFKHRIEQIEALVRSSDSDLKTLRAIQHELTFRSRPKARTIKAKVDELILQLSGEGSVLLPQARLAIASEARDASNTCPAPPTIPNNTTPDRVAVECAKCKTMNFVSTLDGVVQHLSCSNCKVPYEARFLYGVMRTTFQVDHAPKSGSASIKWVVAALACLVVLALILK